MRATRRKCAGDSCPGDQSITLVDDGTGADQAAGDGVYTAQWTPPRSAAIR